MRRLTLLVIAALLLVPAASAKPHVTGVYFDIFDDIDVGTLDYDPTCPDGTQEARFVVDEEAQTFTFVESDEETTRGLPGPFDDDGYLSKGCGTATLEALVPPGTDHIHVRFYASRDVDEFGAAGTGVNTGRDFVQALRVYDPEGQELLSHQYISEREGHVASQYVDAPAVPVPEGVTHLSFVWAFRDAAGSAATPQFSGVDYNATVREIELEYSGIPVQEAKVSEKIRREGTLSVTEIAVEVDVPATPPVGERLSLRVSFTQDLHLVRLVGSDGNEYRDTGTRTPGQPGPLGYDHSRMLVEQQEGNISVAVPEDMVNAIGPGLYRLELQGQDPLATSPVLLPVALAMLAAPLPFALVAFFQVRVYEREAFGGFAQSARRLRVAVLMVLAYYGAVVLSSLFGDRLALMTVWPPDLEGALLYIQVAVAVVAFVVLWLVAKSLYEITKPRPMPEGEA